MFCRLRDLPDDVVTLDMTSAFMGVCMGEWSVRECRPRPEETAGMFEVFVLGG